jgi:hypothetical protein
MSTTTASEMPQGQDDNVKLVAVETGNAEQAELPPLSDRDFRAYNRLAEKMDYFVRLLQLPLIIASS